MADYKNWIKLHLQKPDAYKHRAFVYFIRKTVEIVREKVV